MSPQPTELLGRELDRFQAAVGGWQDATFPRKTRRSIVAHLKEEVGELEQSHAREEVADCFLLLLGYAHHCGFSLYDAAAGKFAVNKARKWGKPDPNGVVHHVKERRS